MNSDLFSLLGGLGLFLLGMAVMTDGLRGLAGDYFNRLLARITGSPLSGAVTGATATAVLQSSSATTVAAVGFVGAGLLSFPQALGVIFGANLGTTVTGWLVALLGLKLQIGDLVYPLVLVGALLHLLGRGRARQAGFAIAGFALVFLGIEGLQVGTRALGDIVTPTDFPADDWAGRLQLVAIGIAITVVTQSSSAGVATALTAVYTGAISFEQAAALVIGMDVGTSVTAVLATLGGSVDMRRTGYSHVVFNLLTAVGALLLLTPYTLLLGGLAPDALRVHAELALVGFHSLFNLLGVIVVLPFAGRFAVLMRRLVPRPEDPLLDRLDRHLLPQPTVALDSVGQVLAELSVRTFGVAGRLLRQAAPDPAELSLLATRLDAVQAYVDRIHLQPEQQSDWQRLLAVIHLLDHLQRLHERCDEEPERARHLQADAQLAAEASVLAGLVDATQRRIAEGDPAAAAQQAADGAGRLRSGADRLRAEVMAGVAAGTIDVPEGTRRLEGLRWLRRVAYHLWRACQHLAAIKGVSEPASTLEIR